MRPEWYAKNHCLSPSEIKHYLNGTPYAFAWHKYKSKPDAKQKDSLIKGSYVHALFLEPDRIEDYFFEIPFGNKTKEEKARRETYEAMFAEASVKNPKVRPICSRLAEEAKLIYNELKNHPIVTSLQGIEHKDFEEPILDVPSWVDGVSFKCIPDMVFPEFALVTDIKTAESISENDVFKSIYNYGYHIQAYINRYCVAHKYNIPFSEVEFEFLFKGKEEPIEMARYKLPYELELDAEAKIDRALKIHKKSMQEGFKSYPLEPLEVKLPAWFKPEIKQQDDI